MAALRRLTGSHRCTGWRERGAATAEAVVMLPVLITVTVGVLFVLRTGLAEQVALVEARRCAWLYAVAGCKETPPGCAAALNGGGQVAKAREVADPVSSSTKRLREEVRTSESFIQRVSNIPVLGGAIDALFGKSVVAIASRRVRREAVFGGGTVSRHGRIRLACNERARSAEAVARAVFEDVVGKHF